jgi:hypothetical protein
MVLDSDLVLDLPAPLGELPDCVTAYFILFIFFFIFLIYYVLYSTLLHLPHLRFHCARLMLREI